jgi:hypothetical protein
LLTTSTSHFPLSSPRSAPGQIDELRTMAEPEGDMN